MRGTRARFLVLVGSVAVIVLFTLIPSPLRATDAEQDCCFLSDLLLNILLFIPLGIGLGLVGMRPLVGTVIGTLGSVAIEVAQRWIPGRDSSLHDVISNCAGTLLGALIVAGWESRTRWWRVVGPLGAGGTVMGWIAAGFLVHPARPAAQTWYGFWAHEFGNTVQFQGQILRFEVQGIPIPDGPLRPSEPLNAQLATRDTIALSASVRSGPPVPGRAQLVAIMAEALGDDYLSLWQEGRALVGFVRLRLANAGLRAGTFRLEQALPETAGLPVEITAQVTRHEVVLTVAGRSVTVGEFRLAPDLFWAAFLPFGKPTGPGPPWWLMAPMGLGFAAIGMGIRSRAKLVGSLSLCWLGPVLVGGGLPSWTAAAAALVGTAAGRLLADRLELWARKPARQKTRGA